MSENISIAVTSINKVKECPRCFWFDRKIGSAPFLFPSIPFQMDRIIKNFVRGKSELPDWYPVKGEVIEIGRLDAFEQESGLTVKGELDELVKTQNGYYIVDYKTGKPKDEVPDYYQSQLDGYAFLLEANGYNPVTGGALIYFTPKEGEIISGKVLFKITPVPGDVDPERIMEPLFQARKIIEMDAPPPPSSDCDMCRWRSEVIDVTAE